MIYEWGKRVGVSETRDAMKITGEILGGTTPVVGADIVEDAAEIGGTRRCGQQKAPRPPIGRGAKPNQSIPLEIEPDPHAPVELAIAETVVDTPRATEKPAVFGNGVNEGARLHVEFRAGFKPGGKGFPHAIAIDSTYVDTNKRTQRAVGREMLIKCEPRGAIPSLTAIVWI